MYAKKRLTRKQPVGKVLQFHLSCNACNREIVGSKKHWKCPYCQYVNAFHLGKGRGWSDRPEHSGYASKKRKTHLTADSE